MTSSQGPRPTHNTPTGADTTTYYFVDESGDSTFFDKKGKFIVGRPGCSPILILGFVSTTAPAALRSAIAALRQEIAADEYLQQIPSIAKSVRHFHAKDDCPEVREKVFKLLKSMAFKAEFVVARKRLDVFTKRHGRNENLFYNEIVARLFERKLHKAHNVIYFSKRGSQSRQHHFQSAIQTALLNFEKKYQRTIETETKVYVQVPTDEACLQVVDYMNWIIYRAFTKGEMRYFTFLQEKVSFVMDIYDFENYPNSFYDKRKNMFHISKISPLALVSDESTA